MSSDHGTYGTNVICPYCGDENEDSWELELDEGSDNLVTCGTCDKKFRANKHVEINYLAERACEENGEQHRWRQYFQREGRYFKECVECGSCTTYDPTAEVFAEKPADMFDRVF